MGVSPSGKKSIHKLSVEKKLPTCKTEEGEKITKKKRLTMEVNAISGKRLKKGEDPV